MGNIHIYTEEERREARNDTFYEVVGGKLLEVGSREYSELCPRVQQPDGAYKVTYIVNATKDKLTRGFPSPFEARKFVNKLKFSKRCTLVSYPNSIYQ